MKLKSLSVCLLVLLAVPLSSFADEMQSTLQSPASVNLVSASEETALRGLENSNHALLEQKAAGGSATTECSTDRWGKESCRTVWNDDSSSSSSRGSSGPRTCGKALYITSGVKGCLVGVLLGSLGGAVGAGCAVGTALFAGLEAATCE